MPFCTQCGQNVNDNDVFCGSCGLRQGTAAATGAPGAAPPPQPDLLNQFSPRTAALLCYVPWMGWIASVVVLASSRFRPDKITRFHAFQGLYLFVAWLLLDRVLHPMLRHSDLPFLPFVSLTGALKLALFGAWIFMIVKVSQNEMFKLPFFGDLAEKSTSEQR